MRLFFQIIKKLIMIFGLLVVIILVLVGLSIFNLWYENNYKSHIQTLKIPNKNFEFVLLTDLAGFGDRSWYVYKLPLEPNFEKTMYTAHDTNGVLFWNYSEAGDHCENPNLKFLHERFLVFSRGDAYHSLYDIDSGQVLVNEESPWAGYLQDREQLKGSRELPPHKTMINELQDWVQMNLHSKIEEILNRDKK